MDQEYLKDGKAAGFTEAQLEWLEQTFAFDPHEHSPDQIVFEDGNTLDEVLAEDAG